MSTRRAFALFFAIAGSLCANAAYTDFNTAITTFNSEANSWNAGPLGLPAFNTDILTFDSAVNGFNLATGGSYAGVGVIGAYGNIGPYPGASAAIATFNDAVNSFNSAIGSFDAGSLDRPDFASAVAAFNSAVSTFNATGTIPPASPGLAPATYSQEDFVTDPGLSTPEPSSACLLAIGLAVVIGVQILRAKRLVGNFARIRS